jgi:ubiquinone/menaquinone biosynthesis C-methylase UbiE
MTPEASAVPFTTGRVLHSATSYDWLVWLLTHGRERAFREKLAGLAHLKPGESVLDIGCGTGSLAMAAKRLVGATADVVGIDASPEMIARATAKAAKAGVAVEFKQALAEALPFPAARFDVVLGTLMLHHLPRKARQACAGEIRRVLKPTGRALVVDFARAQDKSTFLAHFHRHGHVDPKDVVSLLGGAGFRTVDSGPVGFSSLQYVLATVA